MKTGLTFDAADEFEKLILLCTEKNICLFDGKIFQFPTGLPMGGPLSSLIPNVLIDRLERWVFKHSRYSKHALIWNRYVDDVFCVWTASDLELNLFLHNLNSSRSLWR